MSNKSTEQMEQEIKELFRKRQETVINKGVNLDLRIPSADGRTYAPLPEDTIQLHDRVISCFGLWDVSDVIKVDEDLLTVQSEHSAFTYEVDRNDPRVMKAVAVEEEVNHEEK